MRVARSLLFLTTVGGGGEGRNSSEFERFSISVFCFEIALCKNERSSSSDYDHNCFFIIRLPPEFLPASELCLHIWRSPAM